MKKKYAIIGPTLKGKISGRLERIFQERNLDIVKLVPRLESLHLSFPLTDQWLSDYSSNNIPDVALIRGVGSKIPAKIFYRLDWMRILENLGVRLVNSRECLEIATDKMLTTQVLASHKLSTPETIICETAANALPAFKKLGGDIVLKPLFGARGRGIMRISNQDDAETIFAEMDSEENVFYLQRYMEHNNEDFRLLVIGGDIIASMKRTGPNWKTNLAQGGKAHQFTPPESYRELAIKATEAVKGEIIGVDIMETSEGPMVIEVNAVPGYLGLQSVSSVNIGEKIVDYLVELKTG